MYALLILSIAVCISSAVVNLPNEKRKEENATSSGTAIAFRTCEGSGKADVHALPVATAMSNNSL